MADIVSPEVRRRMMAGIRGQNTKPELIVRRALHARGFRYRLHQRDMPGKPDLVFPKFRAVIFVHGCFWHGHECHLFRWPRSRVEFWKKKLLANIERDLKVSKQLTEDGWRICEIWECALSGRERRPISEIVEQCSEFLNGVGPFLTISSEQPSLGCIRTTVLSEPGGIHGA